MLETILRSAVGDAVTPAPALLAGAWLQEGPTAERLGPYLRQVVSRARIAQPADVAVAADYADRAAAEVSALAPAARADLRRPHRRPPRGDAR